MAKYEMNVAPNECVGCLRCQLACSNAHTKTFNLSSARVRVSMSDKRCTVEFTEECSACGTCADHCFYGALTKAKKGGNAK